MPFLTVLKYLIVTSVIEKIVACVKWLSNKCSRRESTYLHIHGELVLNPQQIVLSNDNICFKIFFLLSVVVCFCQRHKTGNKWKRKE
jgi:hypothetical protein